jgi:predicted membrane protein
MHSPLAGRADGTRSLLHGRSARFVSLALALAVTLVVTAYPRLFAHSMHDVPHGGLALLMIGMSLAYVHGVGYVPTTRWLRPLFGPLAAWALIALAAAMLAWR